MPPGNDAEFVDFEDMRGAVCEDENGLAVKMLQVHVLCHDQGDVAAAGVIENWTDQTRGSIWFLFETSQP
jgi:hypothetical protein